MEDDKTWPPSPTASVAEVDVPKPVKLPIPYLRVILVMWGITLGQVVLQLLVGTNFFSQLLGFSGFAVALYLVTRDTKAARINGGWRLATGFLGLLLHVIQSR